jgi:hypothetical protein
MAPICTIDLVAIRAGNALEALGEFLKVQTVRGLSQFYGQRRMTLHAEIAQLPVRLPLAPLVHRYEHGVISGIGMH